MEREQINQTVHSRNGGTSIFGIPGIGRILSFDHRAKTIDVHQHEGYEDIYRLCAESLVRYSILDVDQSPANVTQYQLPHVSYYTSLVKKLNRELLNYNESNYVVLTRHTDINPRTDYDAYEKLKFVDRVILFEIGTIGFSLRVGLPLHTALVATSGHIKATDTSALEVVDRVIGVDAEGNHQVLQSIALGYENTISSSATPIARDKSAMLVIDLYRVLFGAELPVNDVVAVAKNQFNGKFPLIYTKQPQPRIRGDKKSDFALVG